MILARTNESLADEIKLKVLYKIAERHGDKFQNIADAIDQHPERFADQFRRNHDIGKNRVRLGATTAADLFRLCLHEYKDQELAGELLRILFDGDVYLKPAVKKGTPLSNMVEQCVNLLEKLSALTSEAYRAEADGVIDRREREVLAPIIYDFCAAANSLKLLFDVNAGEVPEVTKYYQKESNEKV